MATDASWREYNDRRDRCKTYSDYESQDYYSPPKAKERSRSQGNGYGNSSERETGIIEKLLHSYGFIQCCERELRIFFHYSQYKGDLDDLRIGDEVEFGVSCDQRSKKPVAVNIVLLTPGTVSFEICSEEQVTGIVDAEARLLKPGRSPSNGYNDPEFGRISYEIKGECFYLSFSANDCKDPNMPIHKGDKVQFVVSIDKRTGVSRAKDVMLLETAKAEKYQGVVSSMKESFGFIERADKVSEIFFHYSEFLDDINELTLGDDVEFIIQPRNGKEVAMRIKKLPEGTVTFEDVSEKRYQGVIDRPLSKSSAKRQHDPLHGRIVFETDDGPSDIVFSERDVSGEFSLRTKDIVDFNIAVDRRDSLRRATNITLVKVAEPEKGDNREMGVVAALKDGFGFIRCCDRDARMFFHFSELVESSRQIQIGDEVEFSITEDSNSMKRVNAIKVRILPKGTIQFGDTTTEEIYQGYVDREPMFTGRSPHKQDSRDSESGLICYEDKGVKKMVSFDIQKNSDIRAAPQFGDLVKFNLTESQRTGFRRAANIVVVTRNTDIKRYGFVATLKEHYGFLETSDHDKEVFFHYSEWNDDPSKLELGDEIEYSLKFKGGKVSAEGLNKLPKGTIPQEEIQPEVHDGVVLRPLRRADPQQQEYSGLIEQVVAQEEKEPNDDVFEKAPAQAFSVEYGITSLIDKKTVLQCGDRVRFQIGVDRETGCKRAMKVTPERQRVRARVESVKGQFGFIGHENEEGKNLFFHISEVAENVELQAGDEVEFFVVQKRGGKLSAVNVRKISETQRPEHLMRKTAVDVVSKPIVMVIRKPIAPDGTRGFTYQRTLRDPPQTPDNPELPQADCLSMQAAGVDGCPMEELVAKICEE
ncbi:cold shock domain-containing protein E1 isoform X2 [Nematostella vectensis]|uniref:cold shock domain-containing protein E1 isoform X2 n=1 Tax=Nematostella vectensis TaxID=45351 RepID=UPI00207758BA|nr:cold shock domain-containing protein E1 isoform X2 [Nematostella vectensis]